MFLIFVSSSSLVAASKLFFSKYNYFPRVNGLTLNDKLSSIISQCTSGSRIVDELCMMRDNFYNNLFTMNPNATTEDMKGLKNLVPKHCIISQSDKNVGVSILPAAWYMKEYQVQVERGGYQLVNMTEEECIRMLKFKIEDFKSKCTPPQLKIINSHKTDSVKNHRIGVLKLLPKVSS